MECKALHPVSRPTTNSQLSDVAFELARHGLFVSISRVALVPGRGGVGAAVADVLRHDVPERSGDHQVRRDGRREQGEPHGRVAAPAALPRLLRPRLRRVCSAVRHGTKRYPERDVTARLRSHRQHQGAARDHVQADCLLRHILTVAARDSVVALGGPSWTVPLGRRDSTNANEAAANNELPPPFFDLVNLTQSFGGKGFTVTDMVALSGAHTIGQAQCQNFRDRLYNETNINSGFATSLKANCPQPTGSDDRNLANLDVSTPYSFDNAYYSNLKSQKGLLHSDHVLFTGTGGGTDNTVNNFASNPAAFSSAFASAMVKMGNLSPLTGSQGQVRISCSKVN
ncbi:hypothetical protein VPH35_019198 [Triticum aestivum]